MGLLIGAVALVVIIALAAGRAAAAPAPAPGPPPGPTPYPPPKPVPPKPAPPKLYVPLAPTPAPPKPVPPKPVPPKLYVPPAPTPTPDPTAAHCANVKAEIARVVAKSLPTQSEVEGALSLAAANEYKCGLSETKKALAERLLALRWVGGPKEEPVATGPLLRGGTKAPEVGQLQEALKLRFPSIAAAVGPTDGIMGPKTWNVTTYALGRGWWQVPAGEVVRRAKVAGPDVGVMKHLADPDRVKAVRKALGIAAYKYLDNDAWAALDARLGPTWVNYPWRDTPDGLEARVRGAVA